jgi:OOP family OmpA-OmpF porin
MNHRLFSFVLKAFCIYCLFAFSFASADVRQKGLTITPFAGGYIFEGNENYEGWPLYGLGVGYRLNKNISMELSMSYGDFELNPYDYDENQDNIYINGYKATLDIAYDIFPDFIIVPYITVGLGAMILDYDREDEDPDFAIDNNNIAVFHYGGGVRYALTDQIDFRADVRHSLTFDEKDNEKVAYDYFNNMMATAGFTVAFGKCKPLSPVLKDQDMDGVPDSVDQCPNTEANVAVGVNGCPVDSDNDGIRDLMDKCPNTEAGVIVDVTGCKKMEPQEIRLDLNITFASGKADIASSSMTQLKEVAQKMKRHPKSTAVIEAHTDSQGSDSYNLDLSQKRANMVVYYLTSRFGINKNRLQAIGYGESQPIADNNTKAGRQQNRRAVAIITVMQ